MARLILELKREEIGVLHEEAQANGLAGGNVTLKLKTRDFRQRTRARTLPEPTQLSGRIFDAGRELLAREIDGTQFRLIGIGVGDLTDAEAGDRGDLVDTGLAREKAKEAAIDSLRAKFGRGAIVRGLAFDGRSPVKK